MNDDHIEEFTGRVKNLQREFELAAETFRPIADFTLEESVRVSVWWFLLGSMKLELLIREGSSFPFAHEDNKLLLQQALTEIAKALWILQSTTKFHESTASRGDTFSSLMAHRLALAIKLRQSLWSVRRHKLLSQLEEEITTKDTSIWIEYPSLGLDMNVMLSGVPAITQHECQELQLSEMLPLGDTEDIFHYSSISVDVFFFHETSNTQQIRYPAILSIVRRRTEANISVVIASQNGLLRCSIGSGNGHNPTWDDVTWLFFISSLEVKLPTGFRLQIRFNTWDFRTMKRM